MLSAARSAALFAQVGVCATPPSTSALPDTATDGTRVRRTAYTGCREGGEVVLYTIEGGGHTWPGGPPVGRLVGRVSRDIDATRTMLDFFDAHPAAVNPLLDLGAHPVIAHRGSSAEAPENTLPAFEAAIRRGADALELDVRLTADGAPVVIHDATLDRTTDGEGPVAAQALAELRTLDAGSKFTLGRRSHLSLSRTGCADPDPGRGALGISSGAAADRDQGAGGAGGGAAGLAAG